ncbi:MAG: N-acetyltransferase family protein [Novosphingobium sp.]
MLRVRNATAEDNHAIAQLGRTTFTETFGDLFITHPGNLESYLEATFAPAKLAASIAKRSNCFWVAEWDGTPIGYAKLKLESRHPAVEGLNTAQLQKIYVLRDYLNCRAGKGLHDTLLRCAREECRDRLWLMALEGNRRASDFYLRQGWQFAAKDKHRIGAQVFTYDVLSLTL